MMITVSPTCTLRAAAPLRQMQPFYNIGLEALAIVVVDDLHLLAGNEVGGVHEILVDGDAAHILEVGISDGHTVQLAF